MNEIFTDIVNQTSTLVGGYIPTLLAAIAVLVGGWMVAIIVAAAVRGILNRTALDNRVAAWLVGGSSAPTLPVEHWASRIAFWVVMLFALVGFFQILSLTVVTAPLNVLLSQIAEFAPRLLGASVLLLLAAVVAAVVRRVLTGALDSLPFVQRLSGDEADSPRVSKGVGDTAYWLVFLLFLPAVLDALAVEGLLTPVQGVLTELLGFLPNVMGAVIALAVGWFVARLTQRVVSGFLLSAGADEFSKRVGLSAVFGKGTLSGFVGTVVQVLILVPVVIAFLNALQLEAVTAPASNMLAAMLGAVPRLLGGALLLAIAYVVGRWVAGVVQQLLAGIGFDGVLVKLGLQTESFADSQTTPSQIVGSLILVAVILGAAMEAAGLLGFVALNSLIAQFLTLGGRVVLGLVIFALGLWLAHVAATAVATAGGRNRVLLSTVTRTSIIGLAAAVALSQMGIASDIITLAFGLLLGSAAVAAALAFGLGGRDVAARAVDDWVGKLRDK